MKKYILFTIFLTISSITFAQWEFQYFDLKVGLNHHAFSPQPDTLNNLYLKTPDGQMRMFPTEKFFDYVPGINAGLHFHLDFQNDNGGFIIGAEYFNYGTSSKYENFNKFYTLTSTKRIHGIGIPMYVKFGNEIFDKQQYFFAGLQYNINVTLQTFERVNWIVDYRSTWVKNTEFTKNNTIIFIGFNYLIVNIELDFMTKNFLNAAYSVNKGTTEKPYIIAPYTVQTKNLFYLKTSVNIPLSEWTTRKNYWLHKTMKRFF